MKKQIITSIFILSCFLISWGQAHAATACNDVKFMGSIAGGFLSDSPFIRLNKKPGTYSAFTRWDYFPDWGELPEPTYTYIARFNNIKKWRAKVCARQVEGYATGYPYRLEVRFERKGPFGWEIMESNGKESSWHIPLNRTRVYTWAWNSSSATDYRISIIGAEAKDQFDIMMDK